MKGLAQMSAAEIIAIFQPPRSQKPKSKIELARQLIEGGELKTKVARKLGLTSWEMRTLLHDVTSSQRRKLNDSIAFWREPGRIEWLIEKWNAGNSGGVISKEIGVTPSAIMGKIKRMRDSGVFMRPGRPLFCVPKPQKRKARRHGKAAA